MLKALKKTTLYFVYEIIVLGVIYDALIVFRVMTKNINGLAILLGLAIIYFGQLWYFYRRQQKGRVEMALIYNFKETEMNGFTIDFNDYKDKVLLIVNTASKCGFAPQLEGLEELYKKYHDQGFEILGLPSNQFHQELDSNRATSDFCQMHYGVTFPMTQKIMVNGGNEDPLFTYLKNEAGHGRIKWNFTKFLIGRDGQVIERFAPITKPEKIEPEIVKALNK